MTVFLLILAVLAAVFIYCCYRIYLFLSGNSFESFLRRSRLLSKEQLAQIKKYEATKKIETLFQNNLITAKQKTALLKKINQTNEKTGSFFQLQKILFLGAGCVVLGFIAIVAQNWFFIPDYVKLCCYFTVSGLLAIGVINARFKKKKSFEVLALANIGWIFVGIGLIGQIFHLTGSFWSALFVGTTLATPFVAASRLKYILHVWACAFCAGAVLGTGQTYTPLFALLMLPMALYHKNKSFISLVWVVSLAFSFIQTNWFYPWLDWYNQFFMPLPGAWIMLSLLFVVWVIFKAGCGKCAFTNVFAIALTALAAYKTFDIDYQYTVEGVQISLERYMQSVWGLFFTAAVSFAAIGFGLRHSKKAFNLWGWSLVLAFVYSFVSYRPAGFILTLIVLLSAMIYLIAQKRIKAVNVCLLLAIGRILFQYNDFTGPLAEAGIIFICIGLALIGINLILSRFFIKQTGKAEYEK